MRLLLTMIAMLAATPLYASEIEVQALFSGAAMLVVDGAPPKLLKKGDSINGVTLVDANSREAVITVNGEQRRVRISDRIQTSYQQAEQAQVHISMNDNRQYITTGSINGRPVRYLVDTGANVIAMSSVRAAQLGISLSGGTKVRAATASESVASTAVTLKEVQVGDIKQANVRAIVIPGSYPQDILLGMSFLQHVDIKENAGLMVLTSKL